MRSEIIKNYLTAEQISQFKKNGFLHIPNYLSPVELEELQKKTDLLLGELTACEKANSQSHSLMKNCDFTYSYAQPFLKFLHGFHLAAGQDSLKILGSPQMLSIAENLCGPNAISILDLLLVKQKYDNAIIPWHQDLQKISPNGHCNIVVGLYLDDSIPGDGAVQFLPGTHRKTQDIPAIIHQDPKEYCEPYIKAGDLLVHDIMVVHRSGPIDERPIRRTIYHEFRTKEQLMQEEDIEPRLLDRRIDLLAASTKEYRKAFPDEPGFEWKIVEECLRAFADVDLEKIYQERIHIKAPKYNIPD